MTTIEKITQQLEQMPQGMLLEVEQAIVRIKNRTLDTTYRPSLLEDLAALSESDDLPSDLALHLDHYHYGTPKK
ncbi:hypothetical protein [Desulfonatronovibrio magnus]|uniref:hypothetical protein n=1 Tax=Desulfonatronovibrio magnus TaxID=698827 RepID=UPI0005EB9C46|nr:hypothetical protein [Desulfonatronovibrio magnus]